MVGSDTLVPASSIRVAVGSVHNQVVVTGTVEEDPTYTVVAVVLHTPQLEAQAWVVAD
jgi:hypothetical protein